MINFSEVRNSFVCGEKEKVKNRFIKPSCARERRVTLTNVVSWWLGLKETESSSVERVFSSTLNFNSNALPF